MKTDRLEKFIRDNRDQFDLFEPDPAIWENLNKKSIEKHSFPWKMLLTRAAAVVIIFVSGYYFNRWVSQPEKLTSEAANMQEQHELSNELQVFMEARDYYSSMIEDKQSQVFRLVGNSSPMKTMLEDEFSHMDKIYQELENDLADQVASDEVIEAMIQHYRIKLEILEDVLQQLKSSENNKGEEVHYVL